MSHFYDYEITWGRLGEEFIPVPGVDEEARAVSCFRQIYNGDAEVFVDVERPSIDL